MRIWLDPYKMANLGITAGDVKSAIRAQNAQVSAGQIGGAPSPRGQAMNATVTAQSRLKTPEEFRQIRLHSNGNGSVVYLSDVAKVELGAENYSFRSRFNGHPAAGRSEEHTSELQSLMRISYAVFCLTKKNNNKHYITLHAIFKTKI